MVISLWNISIHYIGVKFNEIIIKNSFVSLLSFKKATSIFDYLAHMFNREIRI